MIKTSTIKMSTYQYWYPEGKLSISIPSSLFKKYNRISSDNEIHSGWPHIKGTRILTSEVFRNWAEYKYPEQMVKQYKAVGVRVSTNDLNQAFRFMIAWMHKELNESKRSKISR